MQVVDSNSILQPFISFSFNPSALYICVSEITISSNKKWMFREKETHTYTFTQMIGC